MKHPAKTRGQASSNSLQPGEVRLRPKPKHSQAHTGVSPLHPVSHRNTSFQPLPRPLGLPPYQYDLAKNFPAIAKNIGQQGKMVFHVVGDSGGVQDSEFQNNVVEQMIDHLTSGNGTKPQFCYADLRQIGLNPLLVIVPKGGRNVGW